MTKPPIPQLVYVMTLLVLAMAIVVGVRLIVH